MFVSELSRGTSPLWKAARTKASNSGTFVVLAVLIGRLITFGGIALLPVAGILNKCGLGRMQARSFSTLRVLRIVCWMAAAGTLAWAQEGPNSEKRDLDKRVTEF